MLKQLKQAGGTAVVHVEPDMFGYLETINANPALIPAAVATSNNPDVSGFPNTVAGFGQALGEIDATGFARSGPWLIWVEPTEI